MADYNKITFNDKVLIDLTENTVTAAVLADGVTAHDRTGAIIEGQIPRRTSEDVLKVGNVITVPAGIYSSDVVVSLT